MLLIGSVAHCQEIGRPGVSGFQSLDLYHDIRMIEVRDMSMEYFKYRGETSDPYLVQEDGSPIPLTTGAALNFNLGLVNNILYWNNRVHEATDNRPSVRHVGWEWEGGLHIGSVDIYEHHHSQHGLEYRNPRGDHFPLENTIGIRVHLIGGGN